MTWYPIYEIFAVALAAIGFIFGLHILDERKWGRDAERAARLERERHTPAE
jgi:hypothetical protein